MLHQLAHNRHRLRCETIKPVYPNVIPSDELRLPNLAEKQIDVILRIRVLPANRLLILAEQQVQVLELPLRVRTRRHALRNLRQLVRPAIILLHLRDKIVHQLDERIFLLHPAENLQVLTLPHRNIRENHMPAIFVDKSPLTAAKFL